MGYWLLSRQSAAKTIKEEPVMSDAEYFKALHTAIEDGDAQAEAVLRMLQSRGLVPSEFNALLSA